MGVVSSGARLQVAMSDMMALTHVPSISRLAPPYGLLAAAYDDVIGRDFFERVRRVFEHLVGRHRIGFSSAADLGCGTGLFARYLNSLWRVPVFGVDSSPAMLRVASSNCRDADVTLLRQDIRRLRLPRRVDLVTANFDTLNHLVDDGELPALFRRVYDHLHPGGHFIFDFITPCDPLGAAAMIHRRQSRDGRRQVTQCIRWVPGRRMLFYEVLFRDSAQPAPHVELHRERTYLAARRRDLAHGRWTGLARCTGRGNVAAGDGLPSSHHRRCAKTRIALAGSPSALTAPAVGASAAGISNSSLGASGRSSPSARQPARSVQYDDLHRRMTRSRVLRPDEQQGYHIWRATRAIYSGSARLWQLACRFAPPPPKASRKQFATEQRPLSTSPGSGRARPPLVRALQRVEFAARHMR